MVIGMIRIRIDHPRSLRSWYIKWINQSFPRVDSSIPLMWCLSRSFQWNTHRFVLLCRHLIEHEFKLIEFHVNCSWNRIFLRVLSIEYSHLSGLNDIDLIVSKYVQASVLVRKTILVTLFRLFFLILYTFLFWWVVKRSNELVDYLKKKLDTVDQSLSDLECSVKHSDKDFMDLKSTKNALDQQKVTKHLFFHRSLRNPHPSHSLNVGEFCLPIWKMTFLQMWLLCKLYVLYLK